MNKKIKIEIVYAKPSEQKIFALQVEEGMTIGEVLSFSKIFELYPEINLSTVQVGVFSKRKTLSEKVEEGDRIEVYRSLLIDPKEARRAKAQSTQKSKSR